MMGAILLTMLGITAEISPKVEDVVTEWKRRETQLGTANLSWEIIRDSRTMGFGFSEDQTFSIEWRMRIAGSTWRVDGYALMVPGPTDRLRVAATDPARARLEFRHVLLEQRLADEQSVPQRRPVAAVTTAASVETDSFGELEQLLIEAAILSVRPLLWIDAEELAASPEAANSFGKTYPIVEERVSRDLSREYWFDPENGFRIVRMLQKYRDRTIAQIDFRHYEGGNNVASGWTALRLDEEGHVFEFAQAKRTAIKTDSAIDAGVFDVPLGLAADESTAIEEIRGDVRSFLREMIDSVEFALALSGAILIFGIVRSRQQGDGAHGRHFQFARSPMVSLLVFGGLLALQRTPLFFPPLEESHRRLLAIWEDAKGLKHRSASRTDWNTFSDAAQPDLDAIARGLKHCQRRMQGGVWALLVGRDRVSERVRQDLIGAAEQDLPAILEAGHSGNLGRERAVADRLQLVDDHFAGMSPYMPSPQAADPGPWISSTGAAWLGIASAVAILFVAFVRRARADRRRCTPPMMSLVKNPG